MGHSLPVPATSSLGYGVEGALPSQYLVDTLKGKRVNPTIGLLLYSQKYNPINCLVSLFNHGFIAGEEGKKVTFTVGYHVSSPLLLKRLAYRAVSQYLSTISL
jgi:hypothetical protein